MIRSLRRRIGEAQARITDPAAFDATLQHLVRSGELSPERASSLDRSLAEQIREARYVLNHLAAHLGIGVVFAFDVVPLPLGTIARVSWVGGNRVLETARGNAAAARVHSLGVLLLAAIPWFGYAAYLLPLRRHSAELTFLLANHSWLARTGQSYEQFLARSRAPVRRLGRWLVPRPAELPLASGSAWPESERG